MPHSIRDEGPDAGHVRACGRGRGAPRRGAGYHSIASLRAAGLDHIVPLAIEAWAAAGELAGRGAVVRVLRLAPRPHPYGGVAHGSSDFTVAVKNIYVLCIYAFMNYEVMQ